MKKLFTEIIILLVIIILASITLFKVDETQTAVVLAMGKPVKEITTAGLYAKIPWPFQSVEKLEKRFLKYDSDPRELLTEDKKALLVDFFSYFRIDQPIKFLQNSQTMNNAQHRVDDFVYSEVKNTIGGHTFEDVIVRHREAIMDTITMRANEKLPMLGVVTNSVRMNQVDLPPQNRESIIKRMEAERKREASLYRSEGEEEARRIRAETDREVKQTLASANEQSIRTRGDGEGLATKIYNSAYSQDVDFFEFWRSLNASETILTGEGEKHFVCDGTEPWVKRLLE